MTNCLVTGVVLLCLKSGNHQMRTTKLKVDSIGFHFRMAGGIQYQLFESH